MVQTVTLTYANKEKDFEIYIYYSGVSVMHDAYEKLKDIDWSNEEMLEWANEEQDAYLNTVGTELGEIAVDAMEAYYALKDDQKAVVSDEVKETVVRAAAIYGRYRMLDALYQDEKLSNAIVLSADGQISLLVGEKESVIYGKEVFDPSPETLHDFIKYGRFLMKIKADFAKVVYVTSKNIEDKDGNPFVRTVDFELMPVYKEETISNVYEIFNFMLELDAALSTVPENWEADAKANKYYENQVLEAVFTINEHKYDAIAYAPVYESVSSWRNKNDYFDIVYTYFINTDATDATTGKKYKRIYDIMGEVGKIIPLPAAMQELYYYCISAYSEAYQLANNEKYLLVDTSQFMYIYSLVEETKNKILDGDNQLYKDLYDICGFEELINKDVVSAPGGYYDLLGAALENETVKNMWATLIKLFNLENVYYEAVEGKAEQSVIDAAQKKYLDAMKGVIVAFANLSPADQYAFVSTLHNKYADYNYQLPSKRLTHFMILKITITVSF